MNLICYNPCEIKVSSSSSLSLSLSVSQGTGFFYVFADTPLGVSKTVPWILETLPNNSAQYYPLKEFSDNIAHSNFRVSCIGIRRLDTLVILFLRINEDFCDNFVLRNFVVVVLFRSFCFVVGFVMRLRISVMVDCS